MFLPWTCARRYKVLFILNCSLKGFFNVCVHRQICQMFTSGDICFPIGEAREICKGKSILPGCRSPKEGLSDRIAWAVRLRLLQNPSEQNASKSWALSKLLLPRFTPRLMKADARLLCQTTGICDWAPGSIALWSGDLDLTAAALNQFSLPSVHEK